MKGAVGSALLLNIVITIMTICFALLIGTMAYSKAYKVKNFLLNQIDKYEREEGLLEDIYMNKVRTQKWNERYVNEYLGKTGYPISDGERKCPEDKRYDLIIKDAEAGDYDYCIYFRVDVDYDNIIYQTYSYKVLVYMKFDFPIINNVLRIPITGETKTYSVYQ